MRLGRWFVGLGALFVAGLALYVLMGGFPVERGPAKGASSGGSIHRPTQPIAPPLDEIDAKSREAMRDLLKEEAGED
jgi:hypothetical protein